MYDFTSSANPSPAPGQRPAPGQSAPTSSAQASTPSVPTVAIIGYGTAGVNAAFALRNAGYQGKIQAFTDTTIPPYSPIMTSYYAGGTKTYEQCFPWSTEDLADLNVETVAGAAVTKLDPASHTITTSRGAYPYTKCVIATGATPQLYGFPALSGYTPLVLRTMDDAARLKTALESPSVKRVLVSGASMVALKMLEAALERGKNVTLVGMNPHVLDFNALPETAERFEKGLRGYGVTLRLGMTIASVAFASGPSQASGRLAVTFSNGDTDYFDEIAVAHGMKGNLDFLEPGALTLDRGLVVDEFMRTSNPDIYAAGDVAQGLELISGTKRIVGIWKNAAVQGACAGTAIAAEMAGGKPEPKDAFKGAYATNTISVKDTLFISAGTVELNANRHTTIRTTDDMTVIYVFEGTGSDERLVGFNITCDHDEAGSLAYDTGAMLSLRIEKGFKE